MGPITEIQLRRDTAANWTASNPILASGEIGIETDTKRNKLGDGVSVWSVLPYWMMPVATLAGATGAADVGYLPSGTGAVQTSVQTKLHQTVSVLDFGADPTGATDSTAAIQAAINSGASRINYPAGSYYIGSSSGLVLASNQVHYGDGPSTVMLQGPTVPYLLGANVGTGGTNNPDNNLHDCTIRDIQIKWSGSRSAPAGTPQYSMVCLSAVSHVLIENVAFTGFQADGVYIGSGTQGQINATAMVSGVNYTITTAGTTNWTALGASAGTVGTAFTYNGATVTGSGGQVNTERHNQDITIRKCHFNGVDHKNRNGISVIDGDHILVDDCYFENCTAAGQPGCIDIEPDNFPYSIINDIKIRTCRGINSLGCGVSIYCAITMTKPWKDVIVEDNNFSGCTYGIASSLIYTSGSAWAETDGDSSIRILRNIIKGCTTPLYLAGGHNQEACDNLVTDCTNGVILGGTQGIADQTAQGMRFDRNRIYRSGATGVPILGNPVGSNQAGCTISGIRNLRFNGNLFVDCGDNSTGTAGVSGGTGVNFNPSFAGDVTIESYQNNSFINSAYTNMQAETVTAHLALTNYDYNKIYGNAYNGLSSYFIPDSGTWTPAIYGSTGSAGTGMAYSTNQGFFHRRGSQLRFNQTSVWTAVGSWTGTILSALPFLPVVQSSRSTLVHVALPAVAFTAGDQIFGNVQHQSGLGYLQPIQYAQGGAGAGVTLASTGTLAASGEYALQ